MTVRTTRALIDQALAEVSTTREVVVRTGAIEDVGAIVSRRYPGRSVVIVADERTFGIAGGSVIASLEAAHADVANRVIFPAVPTLRPDLAHVATIVAAIGPETVPIAVGSGTINDLTKRAAFEVGVPYVVVATAASMDGYTASGAALVSEGVKQTFECPAPEVVVADLAIVRDAPPAMTASGYGDLVGKVTAGADWIVADALGVEPIIPDVWSMVQDPLRDMVSEPERYFSGDESAIEELFLGLVMTGLAIQVAGSTRPASGSEHQFSHLWEMRGLEHNGELVSHGMKVGMGSIVSTTLYERLLDYPVASLDIDAAIVAWPSWPDLERQIRNTHTDPMLISKALEECRAKYLTHDELRSRLTTLREQWPSLSDRLRRQLLRSDQLADLLRRARCPIRPEDIGLSTPQLRESFLAAGQIRRRYTVFDVVTELGLLNQFVDELFASGGYWAVAEEA